MELRQKVGICVKAARNRLNLTQDELAAKIGLSPDAVSQIERGLIGPSFATIEKLSKALKIPASDLFIEAGGTSSTRVRAVAEIMEIVRQLPDSDIEVARRQLEALKGR